MTAFKARIEIQLIVKVFNRQRALANREGDREHGILGFGRVYVRDKDIRDRRRRIFDDGVVRLGDDFRCVVDLDDAEVSGIGVAIEQAIGDDVRDLREGAVFGVEVLHQRQDHFAVCLDRDVADAVDVDGLTGVNRGRSDGEVANAQSVGIVVNVGD